MVVYPIISRPRVSTCFNHLRWCRIVTQTKWLIMGSPAVFLSAQCCKLLQSFTWALESTNRMGMGRLWWQTSDHIIVFSCGKCQCHKGHKPVTSWWSLLMYKLYMCGKTARLGMVKILPKSGPKHHSINWLVVSTPMKNISQLGWLATQYMGK